MGGEMASTVWRGYISFGLISIPVRLYRAARAERVSFRRVHRRMPEDEVGAEETRDEAENPAPVSIRTSDADQERSKWKQSGSETEPLPSLEPVLTPVKQVSVLQGSGDVLPQRSVMKGYEYEKNRFVAVDSEELKSVAPKTSAAMEIAEFVELPEVDPVYFETSYYVTPEEAGEKAYALLYRSMQLSGLVAIAHFAMHSREHVVVLRPGKTGLLAHTMFFVSEVRADEEYRTSSAGLSDKELDLAQTLIRSLQTPFEPAKYHDSYREKIEALIASKVKGQPPSVAPTLPPRGDVVDIADALRRSLANLKKPVASDARSRVSEPKDQQKKAGPRVKRTARGS